MENQDETQKEFEEIIDNLQPSLAALLQHMKSKPNAFEVFVGVNLPDSLSGYKMKLVMAKDIPKGD